MAKNKDIFIQEFKARPLDWLIRVATILVLGLGTYITLRLIPIYQNIDKIVSEVDALQTSVHELEVASIEHGELFIEVKVINVKVDDIINRLDRLDSRLSKHLGI